MCPDVCNLICINTGETRQIANEVCNCTASFLMALKTISIICPLKEISFHPLEKLLFMWLLKGISCSLPLAEVGVMYLFFNFCLYRIFNDLLLWEPTAPSPVETFENISYGIGHSVASQLINTFSKDSFSPFKSTVHYGNIF